MNDNFDFKIEKAEAVDLTDRNRNGSPSGKPTARHLEVAPPPRKPYWDSKHVIGATRGMPSDASFTTEDQVYGRPGRIVRLWRHYKRHWKLYTVLAVIGLAIGLPILFLVIFPAIAQRLVDDANLPIHSASIMKPTPTTVEYSLVASLKVPAGVTVDLKPMNLSLYTPEMGPKDPYIQVSLPEYHLKGKTTVTITNQTAEILDEDQFERFLASAVGAQNFTMSAYGGTNAYLGVLKAPIKLKKNVELAGLNNLTGFSFEEAAAVFPPESDGTNLKGTVILPNPSIVTFELGNVTLNMIVGGIVLGQGRINNVLLRPGNNTVPIRATVNLQKAIQNLPKILASQVNALKNGNVEVSASGNSTIYNGQHITYYEQVLNNLVVTGQVPVIQILTDTLSEFLGSDTGSLLTGLLGGLNGTSLLGNITSILGDGGSSSSTSGLASLGLRDLKETSGLADLSRLAKLGLRDTKLVSKLADLALREFKSSSGIGNPESRDIKSTSGHANLGPKNLKSALGFAKLGLALKNMKL